MVTFVTEYGESFPFQLLEKQTSVFTKHLIKYPTVIFGMEGFYLKLTYISLS